MFGRGLAWMQRRFAKPLDKGSIPSPASMRRAPHELIFDAMGGKEVARQWLKGSAYNKGYEPPMSDILLARHLIWALRDENKMLKERFIAANREISALKRGTSKGDNHGTHT